MNVTGRLLVCICLFSPAAMADGYERGYTAVRSSPPANGEIRSTYNLVAATNFVAITIPLARFTDSLVASDRRRQQSGRLA